MRYTPIVGCGDARIIAPMPNSFDDKATARLSGRAWDAIRPKLAAINGALLSVSPTAKGELITIYIKYMTAETGQQPFAVLWVKTASEIVLGLALPPDFPTPNVETPQKKISYKGLTKFFRLGVGHEVPDKLCVWAEAAYRNVLPAGP